MPTSEVTAPATPRGADRGRTAGFWRTGLIIVVVSGLLAGLITRFERAGRNAVKRSTTQGAANAPEPSAGRRLVPKLVGAARTVELPILIYRPPGDDRGKLWIRPEGGGMLRGASPSEVIPVLDAMAYYDEQIAADPGNARSRTVRAMLRLDLGDVAGAIRDCDEAIRLDAGQAWAYYYRGLARLDRGEIEGSLRDLDQAIALDGSLERPHWPRGRALTLASQPREAVLSFGQAIGIEPKFASAYRDRAAACLDASQPLQATPDIEQAIRLDPSNALAYSIRGRLRTARNEWTGAMADFDEAHAAQSLSGPGLSRSRQGSAQEEAIRRGAQGPHPGDPPGSGPGIRVRLRAIRTQSRDARAGHRGLHRADPARPAMLPGPLRRGAAYASLARLDEAMRDLDKAVRLTPRDGFPFFERSLIWLLRSHPDEAMIDFNTASRLSPRHAKGYAGRLAEGFESAGQCDFWAKDRRTGHRGVHAGTTARPAARRLPEVSRPPALFRRAASIKPSLITPRRSASHRAPTVTSTEGSRDLRGTMIRGQRSMILTLPWRFSRMDGYVHRSGAGPLPHRGSRWRDLRPELGNPT